MKTLDRYLYKRCISALILITTLAMCLAVFFDLVLNLENYLSADLDEPEKRWSLIIQLYATRLPLILSGIIPYAMVASALICITPMLRRGEWTAAIAGGISPQRIVRPLCILAIIAGIVLMLCHNSLNPRLFPISQNIDAQFDRKSFSSKLWHLKDQGSTWYASHAIVPKEGPPQFRKVFITHQDGGAVYADQLRWENERWELNGAIIEWQANTDQDAEQVIQKKDLPLIGKYTLPLAPDALRQELLTREAFSGLELWERGDHMYMTLFLNRSISIFVPILAIFFALPIFGRFENRQRILVAATRALIYASIPIGIIALSGMAADASSWSPWISNGIGLAIAAVPACLVFRRWSSA